jgi:hypothetical protein
MSDFKQTNKQSKQTKHIVICNIAFYLFFSQFFIYENGFVSMKKEGKKKVKWANGRHEE